MLEKTQNIKRKHTTAAILASIPLISLIGVELYLRNFEGWGAWAAAPLLLIPVALSFIVGIIYIFNLIRHYHTGISKHHYLLLVILALTPVIWLFVRRLLIR